MFEQIVARIVDRPLACRDVSIDLGLQPLPALAPEPRLRSRHGHDGMKLDHAVLALHDLDLGTRLEVVPSPQRCGEGEHAPGLNGCEPTFTRHELQYSRKTGMLCWTPARQKRYAGEVPVPGELLREARRRHGLTQQQLAMRARTSQAAISRIERGLVSPSVATLAQLLDLMGEELTLESAAIDYGHDRTLLRENLRHEPAERIRRQAAWANQVRSFQRTVRG